MHTNYNALENELKLYSFENRFQADVCFNINYLLIENIS